MLQKKIEELQSELESYQKRCIAQQNVIQEAKEESQKRQEKSQVLDPCCLVILLSY